MANISCAAAFYHSIYRYTMNTWHIPAEQAPKGALALFSAFSRLYEKGLQKEQSRLLKKRVRLSVPVISIGNLAVGGTGKTPLTMWLCEFLLKNGFHPAVLTRGYGRKDGNTRPVPHCGDPAELFDLFGDEPIMISEHLPEIPVWVGRNRADSGRAALASCGVDLLVLDDGFQHLSLERELDIVLLDCRSPFGNGFVLPAGPLREPIENLQRADAFVLTRSDKGANEAVLRKKLGELFEGVPVFACSHKISGLRLASKGSVFPLEPFRKPSAFLFAGIAGPEAFFQSIQESGIRICGKLSFPDHHRYKTGDLAKIFCSASESGAEVIITTAKDAVRIPSLYRDALAVVEMQIDFGADDATFRELVMGRLGNPARPGL